MFEHIIYMIFQLYRLRIKKRKNIWIQPKVGNKTVMGEKYEIIFFVAYRSKSPLRKHLLVSSIEVFHQPFFFRLFWAPKFWTQYSLWTNSSWVLRILSPCFPFRFSLQMVLWAAVPIQVLCVRLLTHLQAPIMEIWWTRLLSPNQKQHHLRLPLPRKVTTEVSWLAELSSFQMLNKCSILWYCSSF